MTRSYLKQRIKETKFLHFINEETKKAININTLLEQEKKEYDESEFEEENNIYKLKDTYETIDGYVSEQVKQFNYKPLMIFTSKNKKFDIEKSKLIGIYTNNDKNDSIDCLIDGFEIETILKKHDIEINNEDKLKILESYVFEDDFKKALREY